MSLDTYRRKRDFTRTPEPSGADGPGGTRPTGNRRFAVQRHRATRLHYDFRLEIDGVLMSWAVPRGPSLRPLERRMAARTEDHPLEYFEFEGVIPSREYGAGDVIVWDWGTWEPEETDDPGQAVRDGELKFELFGQRLKGRFVLVRTRSDDSRKEDWLLIHKRDAFADPDWDIDTFPTSVKSGRTNDEVKAGAPAMWISHAPAAEAEIDLAGAVDAPLPDFVPPMLATAVDGPFSDDDWLYELKLDGYRVETVVRDGSVHLWTRNKLDAARYFPDLAAMKPTWIRAESAIVDGEVVALDEDGKPSFSLLQDRTGMRGFASKRGERLPPTGARASTDGATPGDGEEAPTTPKAHLAYSLFDLLYLDGRSLLDVPLEERKKLLKSVIREHPVVQYMSHVVGDGKAFYAAAEGNGLEGVVAKLRRSRYEPGRRSKSWLKVKIRREQELVVVGYEPGKGSHADLGALLVGVFEGKELHYAGEVGSGLDAATRRFFWEELGRTHVEEPPVVDPPRIVGARWAQPRLVIRAEFTEWTTDDLLRQAAFKGLEPDRDPKTVHRERAVEAGAAVRSAERASIPDPDDDPPRKDEARPMHIGLVRSPGGVGDPPEAVTAVELDALDAMRPDGMWEIGGENLKLSNLDKVLFPGGGYTKRDLIRYYVTIAPVLLPYLRERPLNTDRWPDGVTGHHFWQKQIPSHAPAWIGRWDYPEAGHDQSHTYIVADRVATLGWLANQAVIDLHPWTSRLPEWRRPTYALIDIDPGENTTFEEVLVLARLYGTALGHLSVRGFPKVTGKRGIQIWVPIAARYTFDETRDWVMGLSQAVGRAVPDLVSWQWGKADRGGKARLDYTQNAFIKTLVAPYAVRPMPGASVSVPITWDELDDPGLRPDGWDIRTILPRVEERGDLFRGAVEMEQDLPVL